MALVVCPSCKKFTKASSPKLCPFCEDSLEREFSLADCTTYKHLELLAKIKDYKEQWLYVQAKRLGFTQPLRRYARKPKIGGDFILIY